MEGKRDEVLARRNKAREERDKKKTGNTSNSLGGPNASGIRRDESGRAYIVNSVSGQAILLASAEDSKDSATALTAFQLSTDPIYTSMSESDRFEYDALLLNDHCASIDWHKRRRTISMGDALVASMNTNTRTTLSTKLGPFILDSRATIHISPMPQTSLNSGLFPLERSRA